MIKLEAGKRYVTRGGSITSPLRRCDGGPYRFCGEIIDDDTLFWTQEGYFFPFLKDSHFSLVKEYVEPLSREGCDYNPTALTDEQSQYKIIRSEGKISTVELLSRRDQFAMAAMQGFLSGRAELAGDERQPGIILAKASVRAADALIAELDKEKAE